MSVASTIAAGDTVSARLVEQGLRCVGIIDDAYDPLEQMELGSSERDDLWARLEAEDEALAELERIGHPVSGPDELIGTVLAAFVAQQAECPTFNVMWQASLVGSRYNAMQGTLAPLAEHLERELGLRVLKFGASTPTGDLVAEETHLLFLDWYLGDNVATAVDVAVAKVQEILSSWPSERPKPLIVLMSSRPGLREHAGEFCRRSGILRGMFYAVPKGELTDPFKLHMHMQMFAMSLPAGRRLQAFVDALRTGFEVAKEKFVAGISDLTLNDYAYIQSLSLQDDGQPLGDYLIWLFSAYFGQLLFADALREQRVDLDTMTFTEALPSPAPPSDRLTELYHCALFDTSVGPIGPHPRVTGAPSGGMSFERPALTFGDVLGRRAPRENGVAEPESGFTEPARADENKVPAQSEPDLYLVINAQCDLAFTPDRDSRPVDLDRSILLLPGSLQPILAAVPERLMPKTELYRHNGGGTYRVIWDTKRILTVPYGQFTEWLRQQGRERVARLRLPFALEVQRAFATDLTRIGAPVMPPIYQRVMAWILRTRAKENVFEAPNELRDEEAAFLVLTRTAQGVRQRCVLTLPLVARLKALLDERLTDMRAELATVGGNGKTSFLPNQIEALEKALANDREWARLLSPFDLPTPGGSQKFLGDRIQVVRGKNEGDASDGRAIVAVTLDLRDATP